MNTQWTPSPFGRVTTGAAHWALSINEDAFELNHDEVTVRGRLLDLETAQVIPGLFWSRLDIPAHPSINRRLDGLPNARGKALSIAIAEGIAKLRHRQRVAALVESFPAKIQPLLDWAQRTEAAVKTRLRARGWLGANFIDQLAQTKPSGFDEWIRDPDIKAHIQGQTEDVRKAVELLNKDIRRWCLEINDRYQAKLHRDHQSFLAQVEKSPLTPEQVQAVTCFEDRLLLVASAGSGKTSTMVAKAGFALKQGFFEPERILMLAFNSDAAAELRQRLQDRLLPHGLPADRVAAKTFHAFGLEVIGHATGKKPAVAPWLDRGQDLVMIQSLVDELKDCNLSFRLRWDLFRIVLGQDLPEFGKEAESPESWSKVTNVQGFWTLNNEVVRSRSEQIISNWLFYNGVRYEYERPYEHDTADPTHRQYSPDFYFPDAKAYLELWALNDKGEPPTDFAGYKEGIAWKRSVHTRYGTRLLEITVAELWSGQAFEKLSRHLTELGIVLDPNPDRATPGRTPISSGRLAQTIRTFQTHVKNNRLTMSALRERLANGGAGQFRFRHQMFLDLFEPLYEAWDKKLRDGNLIDFEDMLNLAADHIEQGNWVSPYELVMVDEFQDASFARARLVKALMARQDACLFAVGDDWQSINRFAGADLAVMTKFTEIFGRSKTLKLETTFRCPQSLCDISSRFIQKNAAQLKKVVRSSKPQVVDPVRIVKVDDERQLSSAVNAQLLDIGSEAAASGERHKVYVMGRYRKDRDYLALSFSHPNLDIEFITAHSSKGLECDHVILPRMTSETMGFPSRIEDDPVMALAMPGSDGFTFSEERRLFYVALTRAKRSVRLITLAKQESTFVLELVKDHSLATFNLNGDDRQEELCPECGKGFLVPRKGPYGHFHGCSTYPRCSFKRSQPKTSSGRQPPRRRYS